MLIVNPELKDAYKKLELAEEYINAMERIIVKLFSETTKSPFPVEFDPDIQIINSYYSVVREELKDSKEKLVRKDFALRDVSILNRNDLEKLVGELPK